MCLTFVPVHLTISIMNAQYVYENEMRDWYESPEYAQKRRDDVEAQYWLQHPESPLTHTICGACGVPTPRSKQRPEPSMVECNTCGSTVTVNTKGDAQ